MFVVVIVFLFLFFQTACSYQESLTFDVDYIAIITFRSRPSTGSGKMIKAF